MSINKLKEELVNKTARTLQQDPKVTEDVINWMFKDVLKHVKSVKEIELSGFGTFILSNAKMRRRVREAEVIMGRLLAHPWSENIQMKIDSTKANLKYYYEKLGMEENLGGLSKFAHPATATTRVDREDSCGASGDMQGLP